MSEVDYSGICEMSYGGVVLQIESASVREEPVVKDGIRTATRVTCTVDAYLQADDTPSYVAAVDAAISALAVDAQDFTVAEFGQQLYFIAAASCVDGGPYCTWTMGDGEGPLMKRFRLEVKTEGGPDPSKPQSAPVNSFKIKTAVRPDGLKTVTYAGTLIGPNAGAYYAATVLPAVRNGFAGQNVVLSQESECTQDKNLSQCTYTITLTQYFGALPTTGATAVEGEITVKKERDELDKITTTTDVNLIVTGDPVALLASLRAQITAVQVNGGNTLVVKESSSITSLREQRLVASFTVLSTADPQRPELLTWTETLVLKSADEGWEMKTYPGAAPILYRKPLGIAMLTQTGRATTSDQFWQPTAIFSLFAEAPEITYVDLNSYENETTWKYVMYAALGGNLPDPNFNMYTFDPTLIYRVKQDNSLTSF